MVRADRGGGNVRKVSEFPFNASVGSFDRRKPRGSSLWEHNVSPGDVTDCHFYFQFHFHLHFRFRHSAVCSSPEIDPPGRTNITRDPYDEGNSFYYESHCRVQSF